MAHISFFPAPAQMSPVSDSYMQTRPAFFFFFLFETLFFTQIVAAPTCIVETLPKQPAKPECGIE
jgi:hypothetical protein